MTHTEGIIATLQQLQAMRDWLVPLIRNRGGQMLKVEADNLYLRFEKAEVVVRTMQELMADLQVAGIDISVGIGFGDVLRGGDRDLYGHEMNLASKLGEDLAADGEILLTEAAYRAVSQCHAMFTRITPASSDITFTCYRRKEYPVE